MNKIGQIKKLLDELLIEDSNISYKLSCEITDLQSQINDIISLIQEYVDKYKAILEEDTETKMSMHKLLSESSLLPLILLKKELIGIYPDLESTFKFYEEF